MSVMTSMWTQTLAQASRIEERAHFLFTPHVESDIKHVVKKNLAHQSRDVSGWDFEKKVSVLAELQEMIEAPSFKYVDWGESVPAKVKGIALLPLALGQEALLDLWTYIMEFCDVVPVRTGARGLFLRLAGCICRRLEFVNGVEMNGMPLKMDPTIEARYCCLLAQCLQYCATKLAKSRILTQDHAYFSSHIYTAAFYRCPSVAAPLILQTIEAYSAQLDDTDTTAKGSKHGCSSDLTTVAHCWLLPRESTKSPCSSARTTEHEEAPALVENRTQQPEDHPRSHDESDSMSSPPSLEARREAVLDNFQRFRAAVGTALGMDDFSPGDGNVAAAHDKHVAPAKVAVQSTPRATLDLVFQTSLRAATRDDEAAFIRRCPHLYMATPQLTSDVVMAALAPFLDRLKTPSRDSILFVVFLGTFVEDSTSMLFYRQPPAATPPFWHCVPGYFVCIQAFVNVFKKVCLRRKKDRDAQIVTKDADVVVNPWFPYWTNNELEPVYDGLGDILANGALLNVFVQVILESTNMYDPHSVDYAFNVLQNAFETAAAATGSRHKHGDSHHVQGDSAGGARSHLPIEFDLEYYLSALRLALTSTHFQILLKVLAFVYATADLLDSKRRQKLLAGVVLQEHFFPLFLHWNEEVRRMFCHLLVYKLFLSSRLDLPLVSDRVLLASSPFFRPQHEPAPHVLQGLASYFAPAPTKKMSPQAVTDDHNHALERLIVWDTTATPRQSNQKQKQERLFRDSLSNDDLMLDLSVTSKLDAVLKMIAEQIHAHDDGTSPSGMYFPRRLQVYAQKALSQYVGLLWMYYKAAFDDLSVPPTAPTLEFNVQTFFGSSD
ncbi:hypothetical protein H310_08904 [Aphanomyces invadans]|uniref:Uncharacterized protein n=1 Tax=Aphanomyces invadans TaxID=157072 RepID=A0A024TVH8_9STRA|nr:hypothetical protein H310_08904 [Aphanomyces invadans]ETV98175.1 hypothetical protein H310_08904 [Aphanomyces invadans]|eukprot:XP_008873050.1 hypothetical protein H310_08904 [Aphanomyces invadans]